MARSSSPGLSKMDSSFDTGFRFELIFLVVRSTLVISPFRKWRTRTSKQLACQNQKSNGLGDKAIIDGARRRPVASNVGEPMRLVAGMLCVTAGLAQQPAPTSRGHVDGVVINKVTGDPIKKASI